MSLRSDFNAKQDCLINATQIEVGQIWVNLKYDSFENPDQKVIELSFKEEVASGFFTKPEAEKLIAELQRLIKEL